MVGSRSNNWMPWALVFVMAMGWMMGQDESGVVKDIGHTVEVVAMPDGSKEVWWVEWVDWGQGPAVLVNLVGTVEKDKLAEAMGLSDKERDMRAETARLKREMGATGDVKGQR